LGSGVYLGSLPRSGDGAQSYLIFIVRDDAARISSFNAATTWSAANRWPSQLRSTTGGKRNVWGGNAGFHSTGPYGKYCQIFGAPLSTGSGEFLL
jgi:hypothetical protein